MVSLYAGGREIPGEARDAARQLFQTRRAPVTGSDRTAPGSIPHRPRFELNHNFPTRGHCHDLRPARGRHGNVLVLRCWRPRLPCAYGDVARCRCGALAARSVRPNLVDVRTPLHGARIATANFCSRIETSPRRGTPRPRKAGAPCPIVFKSGNGASPLDRRLERAPRWSNGP